MITYGKFNLQDYNNCYVITDKYIAGIYNVKGSNVLYLPRGEKAKTFAQVQRICKWFLRNNLAKADTVVALGGGSIGDVVGLSCSIYKRGIKLLHVPTTLIAQVDSSIGGKTAIDIGKVKNAVGTFYPADTLIDINFIATLDSLQLESGKGEIIKYAMLSDDVRALYQDGNLLQLVKACVTFKESICNVDLYDVNERHVLNFGHTVGHALELENKLAHGIAVANGLYYETLLAYRLGYCDESYFNKWKDVITQNFKLHEITLNTLQLMLQDKKNSDGKICFVLPNKFESVYLDYAQVEEILLDA